MRFEKVNISCSTCGTRRVTLVTNPARSHARELYLTPCYICFRRELYKRGVTVHILEPGFFNTNIIDEAAMFKAIDGSFNILSKEMKDYYGHSYPDSSKCHDTEVNRGRRGHDHMVVRFTTTYAISAFHH